MIARRDVMGAGLVSSLLAGGAGGGGQAADRAGLDEIATAIRDWRKDYGTQQDFHEIAGIRQRMTEFLRQQMKYPDFLDIGTDVWNAVYDWHVRNVQPIVLNRDVQGRYTLQFMATTLVLRPDLVPNYVGAPYDSR